MVQPLEQPQLPEGRNQKQETMILQPAERSTRENQQITYKVIFMKLSDDFSAETLQARKERHDIFMYLK